MHQNEGKLNKKVKKKSPLLAFCSTVENKPDTREVMWNGKMGRKAGQIFLLQEMSAVLLPLQLGELETDRYLGLILKR